MPYPRLGDTSLESFVDSFKSLREKNVFDLFLFCSKMVFLLWGGDKERMHMEKEDGWSDNTDIIWLAVCN